MRAMTISPRRLIVLLAVVAALMTALLAATVSAGQPQANQSAEECRDSAAESCGDETFSGWFGRPTVLEFDVSEDMTRFAFDKDYVHDDGLPAHGSAFVTQGYLYPVGTLNGSDGVNPDGSPEFPDKLLGEWTCYGYFVGDGAHASTGAWVISTQIFDFGSPLGATSVITSGYEIADINMPVSRAITGGTGQYKNARGESSHNMLGFNATEGVVLRATLTVQK